MAPEAEDGDYGQVVRVQVQVLKDPDSRAQDRHDRQRQGRCRLERSCIVVFTRAISRFLLVELWVLDSVIERRSGALAEAISA